MKKLILSLFLFCSVFAFSQTIPIPQIIGLPAALASKVDKVTGKSLVSDTLSAKIQPHITNLSNPHSVTKTQVGLSNVDNTSDVNKPISTATQTALNQKENLLPSTPTSPETKWLNGNKQWAEMVMGSGGYASNVYFTNLTSTIVGTYKQTSGTHDLTETIASATCNNNEVLIYSYLFEQPVGVETVDAGTWRFTMNCAINSNVGDSKFKIVQFRRSSTGVETDMFTIYSNTIENTDYQNFIIETVQPSFGISLTDRFGCRVYATTTTTVNKTISYKVGDGYASYLNTPLALRHDQNRDKNGNPLYQHVTTDQIATWTTTSLNNTVDETLSSIKTKLGAATSVSDGYLKYQDFVRFDGKQPAGSYLTSFTETDPTIYSWAKSITKPTYDYSEILSKPTLLSQFTNDLGNYGSFVTGTPWTSVGYWYSSSHPSTTSGYGLPDYPTTLPASDVYAWAKASTKPSYTYSEVGAAPSTTVSNATHTGDVTGSSVLTLATVNSNVGTYNNITINSKGLATAGSNVGYLTSITSGQVTTALGYTPLPTRTFGSAAASNTGDFYAAGSTVANSSAWGSNQFVGTENNTAPNYLMGAYSGGMAYYSSPTAIKSFLGLGSNAYNSTSYLPLSGGTMSNSNLVINLNAEYLGSVYIDNLNSPFNNSKLKYNIFDSSASNKFPIVDNANAVISISRLSYSDYNTQLGFNSYNDAYLRSTVNGADSGWKKLYHTGNLTNALTPGYYSKWNGSNFSNSLISDDTGSIFLHTSAFMLLGNDLTWGGWSNGQPTVTGNSNILSLWPNGNLQNGSVHIYSGAASMSTSSGSLVVDGGIGVGGGINTVGAITVNGNAGFYHYVGGNIKTYIGYDINGYSQFYSAVTGGYLRLKDSGITESNQKIQVTDATDATIDPTPDGSIVTAGGIAAAKKIQAGGEIFSKGDIIADGAMYAGTEISCPTIHSSSFINDTGTSSQLMVADGSLINISAVGSGVIQAQTTVNGSTSGTIVCSMPFQTGSYKKVLIMLNSLNGNATYTFPSSFSFVPDASIRASNSHGIAALSATSITITGTSSTGWCIIEGY